MKSKNQIITTWNIADVYLKQLLTYIDKAYEALSKDDYSSSLRIIRNIMSFSAHYINKKGKKAKINTFYETAKKPVYEEKEMKSLKQTDRVEFNKIKENSKEAMHNIIEEVNIIFCELNSFVPITTKMDSIAGSMKMD